MVRCKLLLTTGFARQCFNLVQNQNSRLTLCPLLLQNKWSHLPSVSCQDNQTGKKLCTESSVSIQTSENTLTASEKLLLLDEIQRKILEEYRLEYELLSSQGHRVPNVMTDEIWLDLLKYETKMGRIRRLKYWRTKEIKKKNKKGNAERKREKRGMLYANQILKRTDFNDRIFGRFEENAVNFIKDLNATNGMLLNHPVVFDSSFEEDLSQKQSDMFLRQLLYTFHYNKCLIDPYHIFICNARRDGPLARGLIKQTHRDLDMLSVTYTDKSYLDLLPRNRLLYLSPYSRNEYVHYNPKDIFIIGINDDLQNMNKGTLRKAKRENIRHAKLPVDLYLKWVTGKKVFPLNHIFSLLDIVAQTRGDWEAAFKSVIPQRKYEK